MGDLKNQKNRLHVYQKKVSALIESENDVARALVKQGRRREALFIVKRRRLQEDLLQKTEAQLLNLEQMVHTVEFAVIESKVFEGLEAGNRVLKDLHDAMPVEAVERMLDEQAELVDQ